MIQDKEAPTNPQLERDLNALVNQLAAGSKRKPRATNTSGNGAVSGSSKRRSQSNANRSKPSQATSKAHGTSMGSGKKKRKNNSSAKKHMNDEQEHEDVPDYSGSEDQDDFGVRTKKADNLTPSTSKRRSGNNDALV